MSNPLEVTVYRWLKLLNIPISKEYLEEKIITHPNYPSLFCITDTLSDLGLENAAVLIDKDKIHEITDPVLAFVRAGGGEFIIIEDLRGHIKDHPTFLEYWNGIIVAAEKSQQLLNSSNKQSIIKEKWQKYSNMALIVIFLLFSLISLVIRFSYAGSIIMITSLSGLCVAIAIVRRSLGYSNKIVDQICRAGVQADCNTVLKSKGLRLFAMLDWSDMGIIYFSSIWLFQTISSLAGDDIDFRSVISLISAASLPFTLLSIYQQWVKIKKWCKLCLMTVGILWIQILASWSKMPGADLAHISQGTIIVVSLIFFIVSGSWLLFAKPLLIQLKEIRRKTLPLIRFKRNPEIFAAMLSKQRKIDFSPFEFDLQFGNPDAALQITVACSPYCAPCAKAHEALHDLIKEKEGAAGITIRFFIDSSNQEDRNTRAAKYLQQYWVEKSERLTGREKSKVAEGLIADWYSSMDLEQFAKNYFSNCPRSVDSLLGQHDSWCKRSKIAFTPAIFVNGYELPGMYAVSDLKSIIPEISELITPAFATELA